MTIINGPRVQGPTRLQPVYYGIRPVPSAGPPVGLVPPTIGPLQSRAGALVLNGLPAGNDANWLGAPPPGGLPARGTLVIGFPNASYNPLTINFYLTPDDDGVTQTTDLAAGVICQRYHAVWSPTAIMGNIMAALGGYLGFKGERLSVNSITTNWRLVALTDGATYANLAIVREIFGVAPQLNDLFCTGPFAQSGFVSAAQRFAQFIAVLSPQIFGPRRALTRFHPSEVAQER